MNIDGLSYCQWQKRNTEAFCILSRDQRQAARTQGYHNVCWQKVQESWTILQKLTQPKSLFEAKLRKGDLAGAIDQSILEAEQAQKVAQKGKANLRHQREQIQELVESAFNEYQLL
jgi:hypothetical protein